MCGTLDQVPEEVGCSACLLALAAPLAVCLTMWLLQRYVYMKLDYNSTCPDEYEPPGFGPMDNAHAVHFSRKPFHMCGSAYLQKC